MTRRELDHAMRHLINQLSMVSNGRTASYNPTGGHSNDRGAPTSGDNNPPHLYYALAYGEPFHQCEPRCHHPVAKTDPGRAALVQAAQVELSGLRRSQPAKRAALDDPDEYRDTLLHATEGWAPEDVERSRWRMPARLVRRNRLTDGRDAETGKKTDDADTDASPAQRARELRAKGLSIRQIALLVGKHKTQIERYLDDSRRAA